MNEFFDNAVDKAVAAFDIAKKKTTEVFTSGKQLIDIASLENKLKKLYEETGKLYFASEVNGAENAEEMAAKLELIKEKLAEISAAKEENAKINGKRYCDECGSYNEKSAKFCSKCGSKFED